MTRPRTPPRARGSGAAEQAAIRRGCRCCWMEAMVAVAAARAAEGPAAATTAAATTTAAVAGRAVVGSAGAGWAAAAKGGRWRRRRRARWRRRGWRRRRQAWLVVARAAAAGGSDNGGGGRPCLRRRRKSSPALSRDFGCRGRLESRAFDTARPAFNTAAERRHLARRRQLPRARRPSWPQSAVSVPKRLTGSKPQGPPPACRHGCRASYAAAGRHA
mmetsp:Transcript_37740/g.115941  ORF Transcript_37740/g.115941 Transcript_37740/m.115941 type:complete len:217 (-) Transcript_37740:139-789(-)